MSLAHYYSFHMRKLGNYISEDRSILLFADDFVELVECEIFVGISLIQNMSIMHHFHDLLIVHGFSQFPADSFYFFEVDEALLFKVIEVEDLKQSFFGLGISQFGIDHFKEIIKVDIFPLLLQILYHLKYRFISFVETQLL